MTTTEPEQIRLTLPYPPTVNHYWGTDPKNGGRYVKAIGKDYRREVVYLVKSKRPGRKPMQGDLQMSILVTPPDRRRRDLDNILKALLDALQHAGCYHDDTQIGRLFIERFEAEKTRGSVLVSIRPLAPFVS